jgi:hypothetical protein
VETQGEAHLANGLLVGDGVGGRSILVAGFVGVADECWAQSLDHQFVVVQGCDDDGGVDAVEGSGDVGSRHFDWMGCWLLVRSRSDSTLFVESSGLVIV